MRDCPSEKEVFCSAEREFLLHGVLKSTCSKATSTPIRMQNPILVLGAGRSATVLLDYLQSWARSEGFRFTVADVDMAVLQNKLPELPEADGQRVEAVEVADIAKLIGSHKIVISLLPPPMHPHVARACIQCGADLVTASYESDEMRSLRGEIERAGITVMNECGLDPGIDHMSAMEVIEEVHSKGGKILKFHSYCGGLVADEFDDNPFRYKISWNPRNVVLAGKGTARFLHENRDALIPYHRLFAETAEIEVPGWGRFEGYANRDSTPYISLYGIPEVRSLLRGTLRKTGFCQRWNLFVQLGLTDDQTQLHFKPGSTYADYLQTFLPGKTELLQERLDRVCGSRERANELVSMGFSAEGGPMLKRQTGSPADFLQDLIVDRWRLNPGDKDLVVMVHRFDWELNGIHYQTIASLGLKGESDTKTAMAKTVGLPLGIVSKALLHNKVEKKGLVLPLATNTYTYVLKELSSFGIQFQVTTQPLD